MKFQMILKAIVFHIDLSLVHTLHFLLLVVFLKFDHHHLTEIVPKKTMGQRDKYNYIELNGKPGNYHFLISEFIRNVQSL